MKNPKELAQKYLPQYFEGLGYANNDSGIGYPLSPEDLVNQIAAALRTKKMLSEAMRGRSSMHTEESTVPAEHTNEPVEPTGSIDSEVNGIVIIRAFHTKIDKKYYAIIEAKVNGEKVILKKLIEGEPTFRKVAKALDQLLKQLEEENKEK